MSTFAAPVFLTKKTLAHLGWLVLAGFSILIVWLNQPAHLQGILSEWTTGKAVAALPTSIPDEAFAIYLAWLRYACLGLCWLAASVIFLHQPGYFHALVTATSLWCMPLAFGLTGDITNATYPSFWNNILRPLSIALGILGMVAFPLSLHLLPDGKFTPGWMKYLILLVLGMVGIAVLASTIRLPAADELGWGVIIFGLIASLVSAAASQVVRFYQEKNPQKRSLLKPFLFYSCVLTAWLIATVSGLTSGSAIGAMLEVHGQILLPSTFALIVLYAIWKHHLWNIDWRPEPVLLAVAAPVLLGLISWWVGAPISRQSQIAKQAEVVIENVPSEPKMKLIFDTDLAQDDYLALLYLLQHPAVEIQAITIAGTGEAHCAPGITNVLAVLDHVGAGDIPVACGREAPLKGNHTFPAEWRAGVDSFFGIHLPASSRKPSSLAAPELIADILLSLPEPVTIVAVGPLTNLGELLQSRPELSSKIAHIYIMGGAVSTTGNVWLEGTQYAFAEWNIYIDPAAANLVLQSGVPVTLVPLDATNRVPVERGFQRRLDEEATTPSARLASQLLGTLSPSAGPFYFWDSLAAAIATDPSLGYYREAPIKVIEEEGPKSGLTKVNIDGVVTRYATGANRAQFEGLLLAVLNQP